MGVSDSFTKDFKNLPNKLRLDNVGGS
jgi:hypothetical protein